MKLSLTLDRDADGAWIAESPAWPGAVSLGKSKAVAVKNFQAVVAECFKVVENSTGTARAARNGRHRFVSEALIGSLATGLRTGDNATVRRLALQRLREKNR